MVSRAARRVSRLAGLASPSATAVGSGDEQQAGQAAALLHRRGIDHDGVEAPEAARSGAVQHVHRVRPSEPDYGDAAGAALHPRHVGIGLEDAEPPPRVEQVVGDQVEHVQPGECELLGEARRNGGLPRPGRRVQSNTSRPWPFVTGAAQQGDLRWARCRGTRRS